MLSTHFIQVKREGEQKMDIDSKITSIPDKSVLLTVDATQIHMHFLFM